MSKKVYVCPSVRLRVCVCVFMSVFVSVCLSVCMSVCLSVCLSVYVTVPAHGPEGRGSQLGPSVIPCAGTLKYCCLNILNVYLVEAVETELDLEIEKDFSYSGDDVNVHFPVDGM